MSLKSKINKAVKIYKDQGFLRLISILISKSIISLPKSSQSKWKSGIKAEVEFWDSYFMNKGLNWAAAYQKRFDPNLELQLRPAALLPENVSVEILDVGAGPLTYLGKSLSGKNINITAIDPLADEYTLILQKYNIKPLVETQKLAAEELESRFKPSSFDLVFARNCIDHSYNPEYAVLQMISVVKRGCYVLLEHRQNEAVNEHYLGLHQWNFSISEEGDFLISSKMDTINMTKKYEDLCIMSSEIISEPGDGEWLVTRIKKI